jgi:hypothetical protein
MNDQGLRDWLAQIEKTSMLNEAEHLLFAVLEAVSSAEFILSCLEDLRMTFKCELDYSLGIPCVHPYSGRNW